MPLLALEMDADGLARLRIGAPGQRPLAVTPALLDELDARLEELEAHAAAGRAGALLVQSLTPGGFLLGLELDVLRRLTDPAAAVALAAAGQRVLQRLAELPLPTIAAIDGLCLGAGLELALACSHRLASDSPRTRLGLPDVRLGLIPGFGGTVRLPRLVGLGAALEMVLTGGPVGAAEATRLGLVDEALPTRRFLAGAERFAHALRERNAGGARRGRTARRLLEETGPGRRLVVQRAARRLIPAGTPPDSVLHRARDAVAEGSALSPPRALRREARTFGQLAVSEPSRALVHAQRLMQTTVRAVEPEAEPTEQAAVLGAGETGSTVAYLLAAGGVRVRLKDRKRTALSAGVQAAAERVRREAEHGRLTRAEAADRAALVSPATGFGGFGTVDLVVVAVGDRGDLARLALREAEEHSREDCAFALTSPLHSVAEAQSALAAPARVVGLHLAEPVGVFSLLEVAAGAGTSPRLLARVARLARRMGRTPVMVADRPGFVAPRLLAALFSEALRLLDEGASIAQIDRALESAGFVLGPFRRMDALGVERSLRLLEGLAPLLGERMRPAPVAARVVGSGQGFYLYRSGRPYRPSPTLPAGLPGLGPEHDELIRRRVLMLLVNEAMLALEEGAADADAIDLVSLLGLGLPRSQGGLLYLAGRLGAAELLERLQELARRFGPRFDAAPLVHRSLATGRPLAELARGATGHAPAGVL